MKIEFIIPTYNRPHHLMCLLNSLMAQSSDRWTAHVIADCPPPNTIDKVMEYFQNEDKIKFTILPQRYNDWGHTPRNYGLEHAKEEWVIMTGEDNYYVPVFVSQFLNEVTPNTHFIYCDMIHNWTNHQYYYIKCQPKWGSIDVGNFMTRTKLSSKMRLDVTYEQADGRFVEEYIKNYPDGKIKYIPKPLYIHN